MRVRWTHPSKFRLPIRYERDTSLDDASASSDQLDSYGQAATSWETLTPARARIETLDGAEFESANTHYAEATHRVSHPYIRGIRVRDRIVFEGRSFSILHINDVENLHREHRVLCVEQVA